MQIPQTTYNEFPVASVIGMVSANGPKSVESRQAETAITVGTFVLMGTADDQAKAIPDATAALGNCLGVAKYDAARSPYATTPANDAGAGSYAIGDDVDVLRKGKVWVWTENAATKGNPVYVRCTASGNSINGQARDGTATNFVQHPTAVFMTSTGGAGLVLVEVK